jgi:GNAT superfamily N-acetyltransferase
MNFYSKDIINDIIDTSPIEELIDKVEDFRAISKYLCHKYALGTIGPQYINAVVRDEKNLIAFHCLDQEFSIYNCPCLMVYRKVVEPVSINYYMLLICTQRQFKGQGYASKLLNGFVDRIRSEPDPRLSVLDASGSDCIYAERPKKIILSSVETAVTFYETHGFKWTRKCLTDYPFLMRYEIYEEGKEYFMMEMIVE